MLVVVAVELLVAVQRLRRVALVAAALVAQVALTALVELQIQVVAAAVRGQLVK
jgi:hypothetical protein